MRACVHARAIISARACARVGVCVCVRACMCVCARAYLYVYVSACVRVTNIAADRRQLLQDHPSRGVCTKSLLTMWTSASVIFGKPLSAANSALSLAL